MSETEITVASPPPSLIHRMEQAVYAALGIARIDEDP